MLSYQFKNRFFFFVLLQLVAGSLVISFILEARKKRKFNLTLNAFYIEKKINWKINFNN